MFTSRKPSRLVPSTVLAALGLAVLTACGNAGGTGAAGRTEVVAAFYPMAWLAERVGGDDVAVSTLTKPGAEPHDLELTPKQIGALGKADLALYVKGLQPAVDDAVAKHAKGKGLDAASTVKTLPAPGEDEHAHEDEHGHGGEAEHGHDHGDIDPHLWLDPSRMATVATALGDKLAATDADHADGYKTRAATLVKELNGLDQEFKTGLASCKQKTIVTAHAAFGYLADRYGLKQISIAGVDPTSEPSPKRLAELTGEVRASGATTVFTESLVSRKVADTLAREAGVRTAVLDPVEGVKEGSKADYPSVMRGNLQTLKPALECS
ncbi:metal ABC transporter substrate-binding protein [Actinomadura hibisca]|uniref:metal ABC transporter substrate-binding protein n=1 Tax=Actinomadura hibisca TaxID=68565 RepID=UPI000832B777|nr:metal ABC transporter substrate-binding protein [Actinomadura hibisca]